MKNLFKGLLTSLAILLVLGGCSSNQGGENTDTPKVEDKGTLLMATTTSTADTGLLDYLAPIFKEDTGYTLEWSAVGTGEAINMGKNGDVSVILVHAKASEEEFVAEGYGVERFEVMYNDYIVIGPKDSVAYSNDIEAVFKEVVSKELKWINRGDNSGTDKKERQIWKAIGVDQTSNPNYMESGQGLGATITMADEQMALCLTDRGTYLKVKNDATLGIDLEIICEKDDNLLNQYGVIAVNPDKYPDTDIEGANTFIEWICSEKAQKLIGEFGVDKYGQPLFFPNAK